MCVFCSYLKRLRTEACMSQVELGEWCGVSGPYIAQIETGKRPPSEEFCERVAAACGVDVVEVMARRLQATGHLPGAQYLTEEESFECVARLMKRKLADT